MPAILGVTGWAAVDGRDEETPVTVPRAVVPSDLIPSPAARAIRRSPVREDSAAADATLRRLRRPPGVAVMLLVRGVEPVPVTAAGELRPGDHVFVYPPQHARTPKQLFGEVEEGEERPEAPPHGRRLASRHRLCEGARARGAGGG